MERFWIVLEIIVLCGKVNGEPDPCNMYQNISDTDLQTYFGKSTCFPSSPVPAWYRFTSNAAGSMSTDCQLSACGGTGQVWIDDNLPLYGDGTSKVDICIKMRSCCTQRNQLSLRNCNTFFIFELRRLPNCDIRYCFNKTDVPLVAVSTTPSTISATSTSRATSTNYKTTGIVTTSTSRATSTKYRTTGLVTTSTSRATSTNYKTTGPVTTSTARATSTNYKTNGLVTTSTSRATSTNYKTTRLVTTSASITKLTNLLSTSANLSTTSTAKITHSTFTSIYSSTSSRVASATPKTTDRQLGNTIISYQTLATTMSTQTEANASHNSNVMMIIAVVAGIGVLATIVVTSLLIYRHRYRSNYLNRQQPMRARHEMVRNVRFDPAHFQSRRNSTTNSL